MNGVVMKFGGTSVADAGAMTRVVDIVRRQWESQPKGSRPPVVVVSALSKVTDALIRATDAARAGDAEKTASILGEILGRHIGIALALTGHQRTETLVKALKAQTDELGTRLMQCAAKRVVTPADHDGVVAMGEVLSSAIVAAAFQEQGLPAVWVDSREVLVTDAEHMIAVPDMDATCRKAQRNLAPVTAAQQIPVMGGFIAATKDGVTTTLGRGGSDYSAAIFGACLDVAEIQIWTDVDGMLTADPRIVPSPRVVPHLSFAEASELAYFGAKVLHPATILPAVSKNIPVRILNSRQPANPGTLITSEARREGHLAALACKRDVTVIDITSTRMFMAHGFLRRLFEVFERYRTAVDVVTTSEVSVSVTVDDTRKLDDVIEALSAFADVEAEPKMAIVSVVGDRLHDDPGVFAHAIVALKGIPLRLVSQASSRRTFTFVLADSQVPDAMTRLHEAFFGHA
ncbi:MAG TPA: lysine-sensitive aspartokinase 3 [Vicinamibacterales bacterium]|nr:lysine-sensitive aspartokinase 3 [Vicinamibacterales bacterium]